MLNRYLAPEVFPLENFPIPRALTHTCINQTPIYVISAGTQPIVRVELIYKGGQMYEIQPGASLITSKTIPEGTKNFVAKEIAEHIARFGASMEISSGFDHFSITFVVLHKYLIHILPIIKELTDCALFPEENCTKALKNLSENLRLQWEKTAHIAASHFRKSLFSDTHPYGYLITPELLENVPFRAVLDNYTKNISSKKPDIFLSGWVTDSIISQIADTWGNNIKPTDDDYLHTKHSSPNRPRTSERIEHQGVQCSIRLGNKTVNKSHPDYIPLSVLVETLGGYFGSRLMKNIREEKGLTYGIHAHIACLIHDAYLVIGADVKKENVQEVINEIHKEIETLQKFPIGNDELETVKNYMIGSYINTLSTPFQLADKFKTLHFFNLDYEFYDQYPDRIRAVNSETLLELANLYLDINTLSEIIVG